MLSIFATEAELGGTKPIPLHAVLPKDLEKFLESLPPAEARWLRATGFAAKESELQPVPDQGGALGASAQGEILMRWLCSASVCPPVFMP
jgi:hypothetical protein